ASASTYGFPRQYTCALPGFPGRTHQESSTAHPVRTAHTIRQNAPRPAGRSLAIQSLAGFVSDSPFGPDAGFAADSIAAAPYVDIAVADHLAMHALLDRYAGPALAPSPSFLLLLLHALLPGTVLVAYDPFIIRVVKA